MNTIIVQHLDNGKKIQTGTLLDYPIRLRVDVVMKRLRTAQVHLKLQIEPEHVHKFTFNESLPDNDISITNVLVLPWELKNHLRFLINENGSSEIEMR